MKEYREKQVAAPVVAEPTELSQRTMRIKDVSKDSLAFNALTQMTLRHSSRSNLNELVQDFLWMMSGQLSVANSFIILHTDPNLTDGETIFTTGSAGRDSDIMNLAIEDSDLSCLLDNKTPILLAEESVRMSAGPLLEALRQKGFQIAAPLHNESRLIGLVVLGHKVSGKAFSMDDVDLLSTLLSVATPFLANCLHLRQVSRLNTWYSSVLDSVGQAIFVFDEFHRLQKVNAAALEMLQEYELDKHVMDGNHGREIENVFPNQMFPQLVERHILNNESCGPVTINSFPVYLKDKRHYLDIGISTAESFYGSTSDTVVIIEDVTEQEKSARKMLDQVEHVERGKMVSSISHEMNNYAAIMLGNVELMGKRVEKNDAEGIQKRITSLREVIGQIQKFTEGLMDREALETRKSPTLLNDLIMNVLTYIKAQKRFEPILVSSDLDASIPKLEIDSDQFTQALINFLNNSADSIRDAGIPNGRIIIRTERTQNEILLDVIDNGVGISPEVQKRLFKIRQSTKVDGHGYGMMTCAKIIQEHDARVSIISEVGSGATIRIHFGIDPSTTNEAPSI